MWLEDSIELNLNDHLGLECNELLIIVSHKSTYDYFRGRMTEEEKQKYKKRYFPNDPII